MKATLPYWFTLSILLFACELLSQELALNNFTVEENLPAGTVVGAFQIPEGTQKVWMSGIQDVAMSEDTCLIVREGGELWSLHSSPYPDIRTDPNRINLNTLSKIFDSGIASVATHYGNTVFVKEDGSLWGFRHYFYEGQNPDKIVPLKEKPTRLFSSGIKKVELNLRVLLALGNDGSLWKILISPPNNEGRVSYGKPEQIVKSGVKDFSTGFDICVYLTEDGSLWRWTEEQSYPFKSSNPVKIVDAGVTSCAAYHGTMFVKDDLSAWLIGIDPSIPSLGMGEGVKTAKIMSGVYLGDVYLKDTGELWAHSNYDQKLKHIHSNVQRVYTGGRFSDCFITNDGKLHFWIYEGPEILPVKLPGEVTHAANIENHLFQIRGNQLETKVPLDFEKQSAHQILVRWRNSSGGEDQKTFEIKVQEKPEAPTRIGITPRAILKENAPKGTVVGQLYAIDSDQKEEHSFTVVEPPTTKPSSPNDPLELPVPGPKTNSTNQIFAIQKDPLGTHLIIKPSIERDALGHFLDFEKYPTVPVYIRAIDSKGLSIKQVVEIQLEDINERPSEIVMIRPGEKNEEFYYDSHQNSHTPMRKRTVDFQVKSIPNNLKPGSTVGELVAKVRDAKDELEFNLVDHPSGIADDNHHFEIVKQSTGQSYLTVAPFAHFNHLDRPILILNLQVKDQTNLKSMEQIQLEVKPAFELELQEKVITADMKPGDLVGKFASKVTLKKVRLTGVLDVAYTRQDKVRFMKGDGTVWKLKRGSYPTKEIVSERIDKLAPIFRGKANGNQNQGSQLDAKMPWRLKMESENFSFSSSGVYRFEVLNSTATMRKYENSQLPQRLEEILPSEKRISLMHIESQKVQAVATNHHSVYFIKDDGTLWQWETSGQEFAAPEQIRTNPSTLLPEGTFNTFFRIFGDELRLAKPIPEGIHEMKIHVTATNGEGLRIEEVFVIEVERE